MSEEVFASTGVPAPSAPEAAKSPSQLSLVLDTFIAPTKAFRAIQASSSAWLWLVPLVLITIFTIGTGYVTSQQVGFDRCYENKLAQSTKAEDAYNQAPPDQKAKQLAIGTAITKYVTYGIPVILVISFAIYALILWGTFNFVLGSDTTFAKCFSVAWYAALPFLVRSLVTAIALLLGSNTESFIQDNPIGTNLGYYFPDVSPVLRALLTSLDLIQLWSLALAIVGMAIIAKKSVAQSSIVVGGLWILGVLGTIAAAAFS
jgi:hypothetical protein